MINAVNESDFKKMFDKGYKVIPVGETDKGYGKCPQIKNWERIDWEGVDEHDQTDKWFRDIGHRISGMGVLLGPDSKGLAAIDIDSDDDEIIQRICKYFYSPVMKKGGKGLTIFFQTDEKHNRTSYRFNVPSGGMVEVFYDRRQIVIPPSWYRGDHFYEWIGNTPLWEVDPEDLPVFSTEQIENLYSLIGSSSAKAANVNLPKNSQFKDGMNRTIQVNKLCGHLIGDKVNPDLSRIVNELLIFDARNFGDNSFFLDPRKAHNKTNSRMANALGYVASMMKTIHQNTGQFEETMFYEHHDKSIRFNALNPVTERVEKLYEGMPIFDEEMIPELWRPMIEEICVAQGTPKQAVFMAMWTALGAALQGSTKIKPHEKDPFFRRTNLAVAMVAPSGSKKSDIVYTAIKELQVIDKDLKHVNSRELLTKIKDLETRIEVLSREKKKPGADIEEINSEIFKLQDELDSNAPEGTIFLYENAPIQKMILDAKRNQKTGLFLIKDEMKQVFSDFRKKGNEDARTFYMKGMDGNTNFNYSTISRGSDYIDNLFISMLTNVQPDVLNMYIKELHAKKGENDGFLQRIILVPFGEPQAIRPTATDFTKFKKEYEVFRDAFYSEQITATIAPEVIATYDDARFEIRTRANRYHHLPVGSFLFKHEGLLPVFSYLYEYIDNYKKVGKPIEIGYTSVVKAMRLLSYLGECAKFLFQIRDHEDLQRVLYQVADLLTKRHFRPGSTQAEMYRAALGITSSPTVFYDTLRELEVRGYVYLEKKSESSIVVHINPEVYLL